MRKETVVEKRGSRIGGRSARVVDDVLRATIELLGEVGFGVLRVEDVAARSGVNKTTIYRRWATKNLLVAAALAHLHTEFIVADTGDLAADLFAAYRSSLDKAGHVLVRGLLRMLQTERGDPALDAIIREKRRVNTRVRQGRLKRAVKQGELPRGTDVALLDRVLSDAIYACMIRDSEIVTPAYLAKVIELVLAGARALK